MDGGFPIFNKIDCNIFQKNNIKIICYKFFKTELQVRI